MNGMRDAGRNDSADCLFQKTRETQQDWNKYNFSEEESELYGRITRQMYSGVWTGPVWFTGDNSHWDVVVVISRGSCHSQPIRLYNVRVSRVSYGSLESRATPRIGCSRLYEQVKTSLRIPSFTKVKYLLEPQS